MAVSCRQPGSEAAIQRVASLAALSDLVSDLVALVVHTGTRCVLGVTGPPGAGKSTLASRIVNVAESTMAATVAPMDGFHRANRELGAMGLGDLKGVPDSFDAIAFVDHLHRLRSAAEGVTWPTYDRTKQEVIPGGKIITQGHRLVVVEGNYLLLDMPPWDRVRPLLDVVWYLDAPLSVISERLLERHMRGRTEDAAREKVASTDLPNASLVAATRHLADLVIVSDGLGG